MKILLINTNPVVSRLTALSARKEGVDLDEVKDISEVKNINGYDIVFVDSDIDIKEVVNFLKNSKIKRRVIFATQDQRDIDSIFNFTILKPFLPSEVSSILREAKVEIDNEEELSLDDESSLFNSVKPKEEEEYINLSELISTKAKEDDKDDKPTLKIKEDELDLEKMPLFEVDNEADKKGGIESRLVLEKDDSKDNIDIQNELFTIDNESKNEIDFEELKIEKEEKKAEEKPKILDKDEITNIKSLLDGAVKESRDDLALDNITLSSGTIENSMVEEETKKEEEIKKESKKSIEKEPLRVQKESTNSNSKKREIKEKEKVQPRERVLKDTVGSLPIEELRQLLRGTKIHITIEFPKEV